ncbi:hypothetical protein ES703_118974 [subsurface metagenome]
MKFLTINMTGMANIAAVIQASDKVWVTPPPGIKVEASYVCLGMPFPGVPPNTMVSFTISEVESAEAMATVSYPTMLAGATIHRVPILEMPVGAITKEEKKYRG